MEHLSLEQPAMSNTATLQAELDDELLTAASMMEFARMSSALNKGARAGAVDANGNSAFHWMAMATPRNRRFDSVRGPMREMVRRLANEGLSTRATNNDGRMPIGTLLVHGQRRSVVAAALGIALLEQDKGLLSYEDKAGRNLVQLVAANEHTQWLSYLINEGAPIGHGSYFTGIANPEVFRMLLDGGIDMEKGVGQLGQFVSLRQDIEWRDPSDPCLAVWKAWQMEQGALAAREALDEAVVVSMEAARRRRRL